MIHRIDRVNPDVDDRVIKPNEARLAENLRFGASTEDTNLSGGTLFLGNTLLSNFVPPSGTNRVVGVVSDGESKNVYFASYNSNGNHAIYQLNTTTDIVQAVVIGSWLNFQPNDEYNVSMAIVSGLLYWTDDVNEPRMINIQKGIDTQLGLPNSYPAVPQDWQYAQIKRPPATPLNVYRIQEINGIFYVLNTKWLCYDASSDYCDTGGIDTVPNGPLPTPRSLLTNKNSLLQTDFINTEGYQYSYYYVYDNNEESRLAPWTEPIFYKKYIGIRLPNSEFGTYIAGISLIKKIVFVYRIGNFGIPYIIREVINEPNNYKLTTEFSTYSQFDNANTIGNTQIELKDSFYAYLNISNAPYSTRHDYFFVNTILLSSQSIQIGINNATEIPRVPVDTTITDARFDSVPLRSKTNSIVQNRLLHGNYVLDRNTWDGLTLTPQVNQLGTNGIFDGKQIPKLTGEDGLLRPDSTYKVGIELLDEYGRPITVIAETSIKVPKSRVAAVAITSAVVGQGPVPAPTAYFDDYFYNRYAATCQISGTFPSWAKYWRLVNTGALDVQYFYKTICTPFFWYQYQDGSNEFIITPRWIRWAQFPSLPDFSFSPPEIAYDGPTGTASKRKGFWIQTTTEVPISYSDGDELYVNIAREYELLTPTPVESVTYKVVAQVGNCFAIESGSLNINPSIANFTGLVPPNTPITSASPFSQLYYTVEFFVKKTSAEEVYYQNSAIYPISSPSINTQVDVIGDCYFTTFVKDLLPVKNKVKYIDTGNKLSNYVTYRFAGFKNVLGSFIAMNPFNINAQIWNSDKGQENIVAPNQRERILPTAITYSEPIVGQSDINGLNKFNSADYRTVPAENGPITSLVVTNATQREPGVMLAISETGISSFYYDAIQLTNVDGSSNVTTTTQFLASQRPLLGLFGTTRPMSITETPLGTVYWWSDMVNDLIRYSNAGLERLGLTYSFSNYLRSAYKGNSLITTWYDQITDEILLTGKGQNTAVFSERYKTFQGTRAYTRGVGFSRITPDRSIGVSDRFYNFIQGEAWKTEFVPLLSGLQKNYVFGEWKSPIINIVTNENPAVEKTWNQVKLFGPIPTSTDLYASQSNGNPAVYSYIDKGWYIARKNVWEAAIRRGTDGTLTSPDYVLDGKIMESKILYSNFVFDPQTFDKINFIEIRSTPSIVQ